MNEIDIAVVNYEVEISHDQETAWRAIGEFEDAGRFLSVPCKLVFGDGGIGSVRQIGENILEVMVGATAHSYTYTQTYGPMAAYSYHGCVSLDALTVGSCTLRYTLVYNQWLMNKELRRSEFQRLTTRFSGAAEAMKREVDQL